MVKKKSVSVSLHLKKPTTTKQKTNYFLILVHLLVTSGAFVCVCLFAQFECQVGK